MFFRKKNKQTDTEREIEQAQKRAARREEIESYRQLLPIGSVILLSGGTKKLMIFGILQHNSGNEAEEYDNIGVPYPEGNMGDDDQYLFQHKDIVEVCFRGYEDTERADFVNRLIQYLHDEESSK